MKNFLCAVSILTGVAAAAAASGASAAEIIYDCKASFNTKNGFLGPQVIFFVDADNGTVRVLDGVVQGVVGEPVEGTLSDRSDKVYRIEWRIRNIPTDREDLNVAYRANLNHATNKYSMEAQISGYANDVRAQGACQVSR